MLKWLEFAWSDVLIDLCPGVLPLMGGDAIVVKDFGDRLIVQRQTPQGECSDVAEVPKLGGPTNDGLGENHPLAALLSSPPPSEESMRRYDEGIAEVRAQLAAQEADV